jgi:hypothetical protein
MDASIAAVQVAALGLLATWLRQYTENLKARKSENALLDAAKIYQILNENATRMKTDRCLVLYTANGGGIPSAGNPLYVSILYEIIRMDGLKPIANEFQSVALDQAYINLLSQVIETSDPGIHGKVEDMEPGMLKQIYIEEGVKQFYLGKITGTQKRFYFYSMRWMDEHDPPSEEAINLCARILQSELKPLLADGKKHT